MYLSSSARLWLISWSSFQWKRCFLGRRGNCMSLPMVLIVCRRALWKSSNSCISIELLKSAWWDSRVFVSGDQPLSGRTRNGHPPKDAYKSILRRKLHSCPPPLAFLGSGPARSLCWTLMTFSLIVRSTPWGGQEESSDTWVHWDDTTCVHETIHIRIPAAVWPFRAGWVLRNENQDFSALGIDCTPRTGSLSPHCCSSCN